MSTQNVKSFTAALSEFCLKVREGKLKFPTPQAEQQGAQIAATIQEAGQAARRPPEHNVNQEDA